MQYAPTFLTKKIMRYNPNIHNRRSIRLKGYDYSQAGMYFITICVRNRKHLFGEIRDGNMILNEYGEIAHNEWVKTPDIRPNIQLGEFIVMPNHIHGIIVITNKIVSPRRGVLHTPPLAIVPNSGRGVLHTPPLAIVPNPGRGVLHTPPLAIVPNPGRGVCNTPLRSPSQSIGALIRGYKTAVTKQLNQFECFGTVWQPNYYEKIIRTNRAHQYISNYIINNPVNWKTDRFC